VFGEPIERDGISVIPVAVAIGGGGGGVGPDDQGSGGGYWGVVRGIGVYAIRDGQVRFIPAIDTVALAVVFLFFSRALARATAGPRRRPLQRRA
jgi:uncharacterized spore protein YtfJ